MYVLLTVGRGSSVCVCVYVCERERERERKRERECMQELVCACVAEVQGLEELKVTFCWLRRLVDVIQNLTVTYVHVPIHVW